MSEQKQVSVVIKALDESLPGFRSARTQVQEFASEAKKLFAEVFAVEKIVEFFKTAVEKSIEAEQSYVQLSNTLANVGVSYEANRAQIDETIKSLQKVANVRTDDAIKGFNTLVQRSGDYQGSLKNMVLTADLATAKHMEFNEAAELVGRVMGGNTRVLRQFGIVTKDAQDGIEQLRQRLGGAAAADMNTFGGQVEAAKIKFYNLAEAVGDVITGNSSLSDSLKTIGGWIVGLTQWIEENQQSIAPWVSVITAGVGELLTIFGHLVLAAFYFGESLWNAAEIASHPFDAAKRAIAQAGLADSLAGLSKALSIDLVASYQRVADAAANASTSEVEGVKKTAAELAKAKKEEEARKAAEAAAKAAEAAKKVTEAQKAADAAIAARQQLAEKLAQADATHAVGLAQLRLLEHGATEALKDGNLSWERRALLMERVNAAHAARLKNNDTDLAPTDLDRLNQGIDQGRASKTTTDLKETTKAQGIALTSDIQSEIRGQLKAGTLVDKDAIPQMGVLDQLSVKLSDHAKLVKDANSGWETLSGTIANLVAGPVMAFGQGMGDAIAAMVTGSEKGGAAFAAAMKHAIADVAKHEGDLFMARALAAGAKVLGGDFAGVAEAAEWTAAAVAMYAIGAIAGSSGGGGGGRGASSPQQAGQAQSSSVATAAQGKLTVIWPPRSKSVIDINDPDDQDAIVAMLDKLAGNRQIEFVYGGG